MTRNKNKSDWIILFFMTTSLFKVMTFYIDINLNYIVLPVVFSTVLYLFFIKRKVCVDECSLILMAFIVISMILFLINNLITSENYTREQILVSFIFQFGFYFFLILLVWRDAERCKAGIVFTWKLLINITIFLYLIFVFFDHFYPAQTLSLFMSLANDDLIVNPLQTSQLGFDLRFSGIFNSGLTLAAFCCFSLVFSYVTDGSKRKKYINYLFLTLIVLSTYNRNGIIVYILTTFFIIMHSYSSGIFISLLKLYLLSLLVLIVVIPIFLSLQQDLLHLLSKNINDDSSMTKVSTLFSRFDAWLIVIDVNSISELIFGDGKIQGVGDTDYYVDNGYFYMFKQSGIMLAVFYILFLLRLIYKVIKHSFNTTALDSKKQFHMAALMVVIGMSLALLNNIFYEPVFIVFGLTYAMALVNSQKKINIKYE